jgi:AraC-like DNA-binding protein
VQVSGLEPNRSDGYNNLDTEAPNGKHNEFKLNQTKVKFSYVHPSDPLKDYIDYYFIIEKRKGDQLPVEVFPSPQAEMVFTYGDENASYVSIGNAEEQLTSDYAISGFFTKKATYRNHHTLGVIMVGFKPWGIQAFTGFTVSEITNQNLNLKDIYPIRVRLLEDEIRNANSAQNRIAVIEKFLLEILRYPAIDPMMRAAVISINHSRGQAKIRSVANSFHLSEKQFKRRFVQSVGIPPKLFSRIVRFQHILTLFDKMDIKLLDVAISSGFYDEAHFIKEFEQFTSASPKVFISNTRKTALGDYFDEKLKMSLFYNTIYR